MPNIFNMDYFLPHAVSSTPFYFTSLFKYGIGFVSFVECHPCVFRVRFWTYLGVLWPFGGTAKLWVYVHPKKCIDHFTWALFSMSITVMVKPFSVAMSPRVLADGHLSCVTITIIIIHTIYTIWTYKLKTILLLTCTQN